MPTPENESHESALLRSTESAPVLTLSEAATLYCLAKGETPREIADHLGVTLETIRTHTTHLYRKFGVHSRTDLISRATTLGYCQKGTIIVKRVEEDH
jgi:DNA-binding CsgD family transcriptional regulator